MTLGLSPQPQFPHLIGLRGRDQPEAQARVLSLQQILIHPFILQKRTESLDGCVEVLPWSHLMSQTRKPGPCHEECDLFIYAFIFGCAECLLYLQATL